MIKILKKIMWSIQGKMRSWKIIPGHIAIPTIIFIGLSFTNLLTFASTKIYFVSNEEQIYTGDRLVVDLKISSDESINVVNGTILYDKNKLSIEEINKEDSLMSLWPTLPTFDNNKGELSFVGGIPNGFSGQNGKILEITFVGNNEGTTKLDFQDIFSVFANDGLGTSINPWLQTSTFTITKKPINLIFQDKIEFLKTELKKPNNVALILFLVLFMGVILVIILIRSKRVAKG